MSRCKQCEDEENQGPSGPVKVIEVTRRDANHVPVEHREYDLEPGARPDARRRPVRLGQPGAPRGVPAGLGEWRISPGGEGRGRG